MEVDGILVAARELKEPLATLRQLALSFDEMDMENELVREKMVSVSERAIRQVNDLLRLRRLENEEPELGPVAVRPVCDEVMQELQHLFRYNERELFVRYGGREQLVSANVDLLKSIVYNFLLNAAHYTGDEMRAELMVREVKDRVRIAVRDYGPALPIDVWREMRRGWIEKPTSIAMRPGSSGLGLFIASRFSRYMNAKVGAVRHRDGTSFYVDLIKSRQLRLFE